MLQKSGREYYDSPYLKCYIKSHSLYRYHAVENIGSQNSGIPCVFDGIAPTHVQVMTLNTSDLWDIQWYTTQHYLYRYHAAENIANQNSGIHCIFDSIVPTPLIACCNLIPAKIEHAMSLLVYFKCCLSHVSAKFCPQH